MHPTRPLIVAMLFLLPLPLPAQVLGADQDAWAKALNAQLGHEVQRCSLVANASHREGPVKVQLDIDERGKLRKLSVVDDLSKVDIGKCVAAFRVGEPLPSAKFTGGKTMRLEFDFHPWSGRTKRSWRQVRAQLKESKVEAALSKCVRDAGKERPKELTFAMDISLAGAVRLTVDESPVGACFKAAVEPLTFSSSENHFRVEYLWTSSSKPRKATGFVVEPQECEVEQYPCSWAETLPERVNLGNDYVRQLGARINCADPKPAVAWLQKQPHVRWVKADGCHVSLLVDGARPMAYLGQ